MYDMSLYREALALFAYRLCSYGFHFPETLRAVLLTLPWKRPLAKECYAQKAGAS